MSEEKAKQESVYWLRFGMQQLDDARDKMHDRLVAMLIGMESEGKANVEASIRWFGRVTFCQVDKCDAVAVYKHEEYDAVLCPQHAKECEETTHDPS